MSWLFGSDDRTQEQKDNEASYSQGREDSKDADWSDKIGQDFKSMMDDLVPGTTDAQKSYNAGWNDQSKEDSEKSSWF